MNKIIRFQTTDLGPYGLMFFYKRSEFVIDFADLPEDIKQIARDRLGETILWDCSILMSTKGAMIPKTLQISEAKDNGQPIKLKDHVYKEIEYIDYQVGPRGYGFQKDGFIVFTAPSGQGKTYFAINMIPRYATQFDYLLYVNLELNENDIYSRFERYNIDIPDNLYIKPYRSVEQIEKWFEGRGTCCVIIDNIDNLVGAGLDPFGEQLQFIHKLDELCKFKNHHALVLTQLVKDNSTNIIDKNGNIGDNITYNSLSGVKQLSYQSRSVIMSAWSEPLKMYVYKVLKLGSGLEYAR